MTPDFRFIANSSQRYASKFSAKRIRDRLAETCLTDSRGPEKTKDRAPSARIQLSHGEELHDATFYFFQTVMVAIEDSLGSLKIGIILGRLVPWQIRQHLHVRNDHGVFRTCAWDMVQALQLLFRSGENALVCSGILKLFAQLFRLLFSVGFLFAEFSLDGTELFTKISSTLRVGKLALDIFSQFLLQLRDLELALERLLRRAHSAQQIGLFQNSLFGRQVDSEIAG